MTRGVVDNWRGAINVVWPYVAELRIFGPFFGGVIPCFYLQDLQQALQGSWLKSLLDASGGLFYTLHFGVPIIVGWSSGTPRMTANPSTALSGP